MAWNTAARARVVELFFTHGSAIKAQRAFRRESGNRHAPDRRCIREWVQHFRAAGTVAGGGYTRRVPPRASVEAKVQRAVQNFFLPELVHRQVPVARMWFQQDGAAPHTSKAVLNMLRQTFGRRVMSKGADIVWPPRSPDLTTADFFLWGHIKAQVFGKPVRSIKQLKLRIRKAVRGIQPEVLASSMQALLGRCRQCIRPSGNEGGTLSTLLEKRHPV